MEYVYSTNSLTVYRTFLQMFDNVNVLDIHEGRTSDNLVCSLPGADTACAKVSLRNVKINEEGTEFAERYRKFMQRFNSVSMIVHEGRTFENWICSFPGADAACAEVSLMNVESMSAGSEYADLIMLDLIALAARKTGLVDRFLDRAFVRDEIQKHAKTLDPNYSFPLKCLSTVQERELYKLSAKLADVMPVKSLVDPHFSEVKSANQFCGVDTGKVLEDEYWVDFLQPLGKNYIENAAPPKGISLYESFMIESKIIYTLRGIAKEKVDLERTGEKKPKLYLHVGPPKHGTTSLQCELARIQVSCTLSLP
jgi:hypothetical protein